MLFPSSASANKATSSLSFKDQYQNKLIKMLKTYVGKK